ncbi:unnamed protein product [Linum trigynum]|uniref:Uncharacterized protein n=1 Tax=Linum trigynum TaxID=586398 RepID=A0AAV2EX99_9ROSI
MESDLEVPPPQQPRAQAQSRRRRVAPPPSVASSSAGAEPSSSIVHLEDRVTHLEEQFIGVNTRLDRSTDLLERIARNQGVLSDEEK